MSDLNINARLTASDTASPVIQKLTGNIVKLTAAFKKFSNVSEGFSKSGISAMEQFNRASRNAASSMNGIGNAARNASKDYSAAWRKADQDRERSAGRMYANLMKEERQYQALIGKRGSMRGGGSGGIGRTIAGTALGVGMVQAARQINRSVVDAEQKIARGVANAFKERLAVSKAETSAMMFGELTQAEVKKLRDQYVDRLGIKFGTGVEGTLGVSTELLKAGIGKDIIGDATELALKAKNAMDIDAKETAGLFGTLASYIAFNKIRYSSISSAIAIANRDTKASGTDIIEGMKRGTSAIATTGGKLTPEQLAGLVGAAIDSGIQPGKSGNFISHIVGGVASADTARGQKAKDMQEAARNLGFGGRSQMAQAMRNSPLDAIYKILDGLKALPEKMRIRVAKDLGGEQWFDELLQLDLGKEKLKSIQSNIASDKGFLDQTNLTKLKSMGGRWAAIQATFSLVMEKAGAGLDQMFNEVSDSIFKHVDTFNFDSITDHFAALIDGIKRGFGLKSWGDAVDEIAKEFDAGTIDRWRDFGKGFASGIKEIFGYLKVAFNTIKFIAGGSSDAEGIGNFTAKITGLAVALSLLSPMISVIVLFTGAITLLARMNPFVRLALGLIALATGIKRVLEFVSDKIFSAFVAIVDAIKNVALTMINKVRSWIGLAPIGEGGGGHGASGSWEDSSGSIQKKSSFFGSSKDASASFQKASYRSASGPTFGPPAALFQSAPGTALPDFGVGSNGIIRKGSVGSAGIPAGGVADMTTGAGLGGSAFLAARRAKFADEIKNDPTLRLHLAAMQATEGASRGGTIESLMNRADMQGKSLRQMLGYSADGQINPKSFYGPIRRGELAGAIRRLQNNPKEFAKYDAFTNNALSGSHAIGGYTDQGLPTDPNGSRRTGIPGFKISPRDGNEFTDWVGPGSGWGKGRNGAMNYRKFIEQGISSDGVAGQVPPSDAVKNVPSSPNPMLMQNGSAGGSTGPVAIHINGGNHDPETLANLVQRRIEEQMNWRTHDTASEYT